MSKHKNKSKINRSNGGNAEETSTDVSSRFSPVKESGGSHLHQGNLTGIARKLKDAVADIYNSILKWRKLSSEGLVAVNEIANIKLEKVLNADQTSPMCDVVTLPENLEPFCADLSAIVEKMARIQSTLSDIWHTITLYIRYTGALGTTLGLFDIFIKRKVVQKLESISVLLGSLHHLEQYHQDDREVIFQTWSIKDFVTTCSQLCSMYRTELSLKQKIAETIAHAANRNLMMFYVASWVHQPYIADRDRMLIDSMLLETGHKT